MKQFVITGIGTDVGKTVVSAIVAEALKATYWKPVQAGDLDNSDTIKVKKLCSESVNCLPEKHALSAPISPHAAAAIDGVEITKNDFVVPKIEGNLIIEGAGGLLVPINQKGETYLDIFEKFNLPTILVSRHYLGSINHTCLSIEALQNRNIAIKGIIYVGEEHKTTESIISTKYQLPVLGRIPITENLNSEFIKTQANILKNSL
ncbi:MAG: dethiobiotin synthase [Lishizhenia sp.]